MGLSGFGWACTISVLCFATFGIMGCLKIIISFLMLVLGFFVATYVHMQNIQHRKREATAYFDVQETTGLQLKPLPQLHRNSNEQVNITGHKEVDYFLREIQDIVISDYVCSWYKFISADDEFINAVKHCSDNVAISVSSRVKSVDWLMHITGKMVEDMACHLRLFRSAGGNVTTSSVRQPHRGSPAHSPARSGFHRRNKSDTDVANFSGLPPYGPSIRNVQTKNNLEQRFFEIESEIQKRIFCRESISLDDDKKNLFLEELSQIILMVSMKDDELKCRVTQCILRNIISFGLRLIFDYITNPDTLNSLLLRMCCRESLSTESFLTVLRTTDNIDELKATLALVQKEIHNLASQDSGGECEITIKQQLSSLQYLTRVLNNRTSILTPNPSLVAPVVLMTKLPLGFLLDNHLALCYFLDFAHSMSAHPYIFCHLSIEAWQANALVYLAEIDKNVNDKAASAKMITSAALTISDQYFSSDSRNKLDIPSNIIIAFNNKLNQPIDYNCLNWFDDIKKHVYSKLECVEEAFRNSNQYSRLLAELDLEENVPNESPQKQIVDHRRTGSMGNASSHSSTANNEISTVKCAQQSTNEKTLSQSNQDSPCRLEVVIVETGLMQDRGKTYGVYALEVKKWDSIGRQYCWHVYRRYSDFHELNAIIKEAYPELGKMEFPSKKTFHNTSRNVLERRMVLLSSWISTLASLGSPGGPQRYAPLHLYLLPFLSPRGPQDKQLPTGINSIIVQPLRQGMRTLRNVPEHFANTVDDIMGGLSKLINNNKTTHIVPNVSQAAVNLPRFDIEGLYESEELPLRFVLLLLDEVFELRCRNRWLRRQIVTILRQILTTMFSDVLNRKIIDTITSATSASSIANMLNSFKRSYYMMNDKLDTDRDLSAKARARVAAKTVLLSCRQEELKHLIGSQTTQRGVITLFELFQNQTLNTRLIFVLFEGLFKVLFPERNLDTAFQKMLQQSQL